MANSIEQIAAINCAELGPQKAQCVHAIATLLLTAAMKDERDREIILTCTGILATALGIDARQALEMIHAGAADLGMKR